VRRVLATEGLALQGNPPREPVPKRPWPQWLEWKPNRVWVYDFTHFTRARRAVVAVLDMVSRKWLATLRSAEETSTQVEIAFTYALDAEQLLDDIDARDSARLPDALRCGDRVVVEAVTAEGELPLLLAVSDNGPQDAGPTPPGSSSPACTSPSTSAARTPRQTKPGSRPFGQVKGEWPHLEKITDSGELELELDRVRLEYNSIRLHASIYVTRRRTQGPRRRNPTSTDPRGLTAVRQARIDYRRNPTENQP
jgi:putative transposase